MQLIAIVLAFCIPILAALVAQNMRDEKPYTLLVLVISLFTAFIVAVILLY